MGHIETALALQAAVREGNTAAALRLASELQDMAPDDADARFVLAATLLAANDFDGATAILRELPNDPRALMLLGRLTRTKAERLAYMGRALELAPDDPDARAQVELAHRFSEQAMGAAADALRAGDLARGFRMMERFVLATNPEPDPPHWDGRRVDRLLVLGNLGDGDLLQFLRYVPAAAARCGHVVVAARTSLVELLRQNGFDARDGDALPLQALQRDADAQIEAMLLPAVVGGGYGQRGGYLRAAAPRDFGPGFHVGVNWTASKTDDGRTRTIDPAVMAPLGQVPGVTYHCLAFGDRAKDAPAWVQPLALGDYADTASAYAGLDLVITVDSSPAHLAGALNVPLWVALPGPRADWRFETHPSKWRWYGRSRLFRGQHCFEAMASMLDKLVKTGRAMPAG